MRPYVASLTAIGIGLCAASATAEVSSSAADESIFLEPVQECIDALSVEACAPVRAVITECAEELDPDRCDDLFVHPQKVFEDSVKVERAEQTLADTSSRLPEFEDVHEGTLPDDALEASRFDAERTFLRGHRNQMTHSTPPTLSGD